MHCAISIKNALCFTRIRKSPTFRRNYVHSCGPVFSPGRSLRRNAISIDVIPRRRRRTLKCVRRRFCVEPDGFFSGKKRALNASTLRVPNTSGCRVGCSANGKMNGKKNRKNRNFDVRNNTRETEKRNRYLFIFLLSTETAKSLTTVAVLYNEYCVYMYI